MNLLYAPTLASDLKEAFIFIDTCTLIATYKHHQLLYPFIIDLIKNHDCAFCTVGPVQFEFTRGSDDVNAYTDRLNYLQILVSSLYPIERELDKLKNFTVVLQKIKGTISYTDFLLYCCLYKFPKAYLLTENHKDFTTEILDRRYIVTIDTDKEIRHQAFYQISLDKFHKAEAAFANKR